MSTRIGTLQASKVGRPMWSAAFLAAIVVLGVAVASISLGRDEVAQDAPAVETVEAISGSSVATTTANTPFELSGGGVHVAANPTAANTPSELSGGFVEPPVPDELTAAERYDLHQRI